MRIETVNIEDLKLYDNNTKIHTKSQREALSNSISRFGMIVPVIIGKDDVVIAGHGRVETLKEMGETEVPAIRIEHLTAEQEGALRIVDNKVAIETGFDSKTLQEELNKLFNFRMEDFGFGFPSLVDDVEDNTSIQPEYGRGDGKGGNINPNKLLPKLKCPSCGFRFNPVLQTPDLTEQPVVLEELDKALEEFLNT